jgi:hypothetical protein
VNIDLNIDGIIAEAKGSLAKYKENKTYNKESYDELLGKYSSAITIIEMLRKENEQLRSSSLPNKGEIESIGAIMNLVGIDKLDSEGIKKLKNLSSEFDDFNK